MKKWNKILSSLLLLIFVFGFQQSAYAALDYWSDVTKAVKEYVKVTKEEDMSNGHAYQWISKYWKDNWMSHYDTDVTSVNVKITKNATTGESIYTVDVYVRVSRTLTEHYPIVTGPGTQKNNYIPELNVLNTQKNPKIEIAIDMADKDVLGTLGFEESAGYSLVYGGSGSTNYGNQSVQSNVKYSGSKALKLHDTISGSNGNYYDMSLGQSNSKGSFFMIANKVYPENGQWLSISYKVRNSGSQGYVHSEFRAANFVYRGQPWGDLKYAQSIDFRNPPLEIRVTGGTSIHDGAVVNLAAQKGSGSTYIGHYKFDKANSKLVYFNTLRPAPSTGTTGRGTFNAGDNVLIETWPQGSANRATVGDTDWTTKSCNFQLPNDTSYYDFKKDGATLLFNWNTDGDAYIDDIKYGKASKVEIMRDNTTLIYSDYGSDVTDTNAYAPASTPSVTSAITKSQTVDFEFKANDTSVTHTYKARSLGSSGKDPSEWSKAYPVTLNSKIQGYSVKVDKNATTDPGTAKNNANGKISVSGYREGDIVYCHIRAVNQHGTWSAPIHYKYIVKQTAADLKEDCSAFTNKLVVDNESDITSIRNQITKLRTNANIPYAVSNIDKDKATKHTKGKVQITTTINGQSQVSSTPIKSKPVYQTEQELKEDITDYLGQTSIHNNNKQIPEVLSYDKSKNIDKIKQDIISKCKTNPDLKDVSIEFTNSATEFSSGELEGKIYLED